MLLTISDRRQRLLAAMEYRLAEPRERAREATRNLRDAISLRLTERQTALSSLAGRLNALSPLATLERGYAVARRSDGRPVASVRDLTEGGAFTLRLRDGEADATVTDVRPSALEAP